jgi:hypothetical protein
MCFCFNGEGALVAYRPDDCGEGLLKARSGAQPLVGSVKPSRQESKGAVHAAPSLVGRPGNAYPL